jgi:hypothetical protein
MEEVIPAEPMFTRLPIIVAHRAAVVYAPDDMDTWDYLDHIESAIGVAVGPSRAAIAVGVGITRPAGTTPSLRASSPLPAEAILEVEERAGTPSQGYRRTAGR